MSDKAMTMILELLKDAFEHANIPSSFYEAKKIINKLRLNYEKIHCMLYWGNREDEERETCKVCNTSRWKSRAKINKFRLSDDDNSMKKVPAKVLRYFPLKSQLQRLFQSSKTAENMRWHDVNSKNDGMMRHPRDCEAWKWFDLTHPWFASDTLSRWNTYTRLACPSCNFDFIPCHLPYSRKWCFMGHRRFLDQKHRFRLNRIRFNGEKDLRSSPKALSGFEILEQVQNINVTFGRISVQEGTRKRTRGGHLPQSSTQQWKKKRIFFELPYWKDNCLRHNLDMMHIEKNVCDNVIYTLLNDSVKTKDNVNARKDLQAMGIRPELWPNEHGKYPLAIFTLTNKGKKAFLTTLKNITVPDGYSSNISRCIDLDNLKLNGMLKSHDSHVLMEQFLPLAMRTALPDKVSAILIEFCSFFRQLCGKVLKIKDLDKLQNQIVSTLCHMEMLFPPSFFTVMLHLVVHLVEETKLGGPVHYRWMYPIERYLGQLKSYVCNKAQPEGSIAEGYLVQEILTFCSRQSESQIGELFPVVGKPVGGSSFFTLTPKEKLQALRHVLTNCPVVDYYLQQFRNIVRKQLRGGARNVAEVDKKVHRDFVRWFSNRVSRDVLFSLAQGPFDRARRFTAFNVNGHKFQTLTRDKFLKTQNSGVFGTFGTRSYSSNNDAQMRFGGVPYYGRLIDIIEIFYNGFTVPMFKCQWADTTTSRGMKEDKLGFISINFARLIHTGEKDDDEPYIKASEAQMVYYVEDEKEQGWSIPIHLKPRDFYDMGEDDEEFMASIEAYPSQNLEQIFPDDATHIQLARVTIDDDPENSTINENFDEDNQDMV
uniref:DUF4218 domain-containing protein n=1 Tax=Cajanus cajan TaxID=3821 RepID=A0A151UG06_CAJCA